MIKGRRVKVDDLSKEERNALVGQRVVACFERHADDGFDAWDIGTVTTARKRDGIEMFIKFDSTQEEIGVFAEEHIIILTNEG